MEPKSLTDAASAISFRQTIMTAIDGVRRVLIDCRDQALCDQCLAVMRAATLTETLQMTRAILAADAAFQRGGACVRCHRTIPTITYRGKCVHCSDPFNASDLGLDVAGERFHSHCLRRIITDDTIRLSRALGRRSRLLIEQSRRRLRER